MNTFNGIPLLAQNGSTGNVLPLLHEIRHALEKFLADGEESLLDLHGLPLTSADEAALLAALGRGEVSAELDSLGVSHIRETAYAGVWLVEHLDPEGRRIAYHIAICQIPAIVKSEYQDMLEALGRLQERLDPA